MGETKEEKAAREAQEAADKLAAEAEAEKESINPASHLVEVQLHGDNPPSVLTNVHTIFHAKGSTEFVNGAANVNPDVADHLKESGQIK